MIMRDQLKVEHTVKHFYFHLLRNTILGFVIIIAALFMGMLGYHVFEKLPWVDAFLNAAMILGGMGPVNTLYTEAGKLFAGFYALFSGLAFIAIVAIMLSPVIHKLLRKIHLEGKSKGKGKDKSNRIF
jgi:hypothetical protein